MTKRPDLQSKNAPTSDFKTFPKFSKLTLADKVDYEALVANYPPLTDISFASLMIWWNTLDSCAVALLNENLVLSYWLPGDEKNTGLALVGTNKIDESICTILDFLRMEGKPDRLVHVPAFVLSNVKYPEMFRFTPEPDYDECILPVSKFYPLSRNTPHRKQSISKFLADAGKANIITRALDLQSRDTQLLLLDLVAQWKKFGTINHTIDLEYEAVRSTIIKASSLGLEGVGIYLKDELVSFCLYQLPADQRYVIVNHLKADFSRPHTFDFIVYTYAGWFAGLGVQFGNIEMDWGLPALRALRLSLGPSDFLRKYTVEAAN